MMIKLSKEEMLREWKRRKGMLPVSTSTLQVVGVENQSVDEMLQAEIDDWYSALLTKGGDGVSAGTRFRGGCKREESG